MIERIFRKNGKVHEYILRYTESNGVFSKGEIAGRVVTDNVDKYLAERNEGNRAYGSSVYAEIVK